MSGILRVREAYNPSAKDRDTITDFAFRRATTEQRQRSNVTKGMGTEVRAEPDGKPGTPILFSCSDAEVDRYDSIIALEGWDLSNFALNPMMPWCHDTRSPPIGRWQNWRVQDDALKMEAVFTPEDMYALGAMVEKMYRARFMNAVSVGFMPKEWEVDEDRQEDNESWMPSLNYLEQELLECSPVPVPGNAGALADRAADSFRQARAAGINTNPMLHYLERELDEKRKLWLPRDVAERLHRDLGPQTITSLPADPGKERTVERKTRTIVIEANADQIENVLKDLDKKARQMGAKFALRTEGDGDGGDIYRDLKAAVKDLQDVHKGFKDGADTHRDATEMHGKNNDEMGKHVETLGAICKDLGALTPDKTPADKNAPTGERGGAPHKLSSANAKDHAVATEALQRIGARHMGDTAGDNDGDEDDAKKKAADAKRKEQEEQVVALKKELDELTKQNTGRMPKK